MAGGEGCEEMQGMVSSSLGVIGQLPGPRDQTFTFKQTYAKRGIYRKLLQKNSGCHGQKPNSLRKKKNPNRNLGSHPGKPRDCLAQGSVPPPFLRVSCLLRLLGADSPQELLLLKSPWGKAEPVPWYLSSSPGGPGLTIVQ